MQVFGIHVVDSFLDKRCGEVVEIMVLEHNKSSRLQDLVQKAKSNGIKITFVPELSQIGAQGIAAKIKLAWEGIGWLEWLQLNADKNIVMLDGVQDPHNLGACMRTACALGAGAIIIPSRKAAPLNATALKVASGAGAWLPVFTVSNLLACIKVMKSLGYWVICCSEHSELVLGPQECKGKKKLLVVGNEQKGIRSSIMQESDYKFKLPTTGPIKSLNVSVALGVALSLLDFAF